MDGPNISLFPTNPTFCVKALTSSKSRNSFKLVRDECLARALLMLATAGVLQELGYINEDKVVQLKGKTPLHTTIH